MASVGFREPEKSVKVSINFATPAASMEEEEDDEYEDDLEQRIQEYKFDNAEDVEELKRCIQDVMNEAERIAQERLDTKAVSSFPIHTLTSPRVFSNKIYINLLRWRRHEKRTSMHS